MHDYAQQVDHVIMSEMLGYLDSLLIDASEYLYALYQSWATHYMTNQLGKDVLEVLVAGRRRAWWCARPIMATRETPLASPFDPEHSELIQRYYAQLLEHQMKKGNARIVIHCRIRWDEHTHGHTHSNVIVLMRDEMTGQWNATVIEPGERMCQPFVRLVRRLFASSQTLRMCHVRLVAAHAQRKYRAYATTLGYGRFPVCRHLTLFLAYRALRGESVQYQTVHLDDVEMQLHRPFLSFCETVLDVDVETRMSRRGCRDATLRPCVD